MRHLSAVPSNAVERARAGAAFLDEHRPGWWRRVDADLLDMSHCSLCVVGQVSGHYFLAGASELGLGRRGERAISLGFYSPDEDEYPLLDAAWRDLIEERQREEEGHE